jgi:ABC-type Fe3+ transport system permease subunit
LQTDGQAVWVAGLSIAVLLAIASPLASAHPDGLEWVAEQIGFLDAAQEPLYTLIPDYVFPGISNEALATILAGIVGALIVLGAALAVGYTRRKAQSAASNS